MNILRIFFKLSDMEGNVSVDDIAISGGVLIFYFLPLSTPPFLAAHSECVGFLFRLKEMQLASAAPATAFRVLQLFHSRRKTG